VFFLQSDIDFPAGRPCIKVESEDIRRNRIRRSSQILKTLPDGLRSVRIQTGEAARPKRFERLTSHLLHRIQPTPGASVRLQFTELSAVAAGVISEASRKSKIRQLAVRTGQKLIGRNSASRGAVDRAPAGVRMCVVFA